MCLLKELKRKQAYLVSPLNDNPLNSILKLNITLFSRRSTCSPLLLIDMGSSLSKSYAEYHLLNSLTTYLWKWQQSFALYMTSNLIDTGCKLVYLLLDIWSSNKWGESGEIGHVKLPSEIHCGNLDMLHSFLRMGTITSSTRAQKCSSELGCMSPQVMWFRSSPLSSGKGSDSRLTKNTPLFLSGLGQSVWI